MSYEGGKMKVQSISANLNFQNHSTQIQKKNQSFGGILLAEGSELVGVFADSQQGRIDKYQHKYAYMPFRDEKNGSLKKAVATLNRNNYECVFNSSDDLYYYDKFVLTVKDSLPFTKRQFEAMEMLFSPMKKFEKIDIADATIDTVKSVIKNLK